MTTNTTALLPAQLRMLQALADELKYAANLLHISAHNYHIGQHDIEHELGEVNKYRKKIRKLHRAMQTD